MYNTLIQYNKYNLTVCVSQLNLVMEISTNDYGYQNERLIEKTKNGKEVIYRKKQQSTAQNLAMERAGK